MSNPSVAPLLALAALSVSACLQEPTGVGDDPADAVLSARPAAPTGEPFDTGTHVLDVGVPRPAILYLPPDHDPETAAPLLVMFHGAGGSAGVWQSPIAAADRLGFVVLLMQSTQDSWDLFRFGWGPDVAALDRALALIFDRVAIDPDAVVFGGFSDGASYALSLALINPELVRHGIGFSPGFVVDERKEPLPRIFVSHGTSDAVLSVEFSRGLVDELRDDGFDVTYREFEGGHDVPPEVSAAAYDWIVE